MSTSAHSGLTTRIAQARERSGSRYHITWSVVGFMLLSLLAMLLLSGCSTSGRTAENEIPSPVLASMTPSQTSVPSPLPATHTSTSSPTWTSEPTSTNTATPTPTYQPIAEGTRVQRSTELIATNNAHNIVQLARWGFNVYDFSWSPDGSYLAVATSVGVFLYDVQTWEVKQFIETGFQVSFLSVSSDGGTLALGSFDELITLWRVADGILQATLQGHTKPVSKAIFTPDGQKLISWSEDGSICLWSTLDGSLLYKLDTGGSNKPFVSLSPDGEILATVGKISAGSYHNFIRLFRVEDGSLLYTLEGHLEGIRRIAFSPDSQKLASTDGSTIRMWQVESGSILYELDEFNNTHDIIFSPDGESLILDGGLSASRLYWSSYAIRLLHAEDGTHMGNLDTRNNYEFSNFTYSPDGQYLAAWGWMGFTFFWQYPGGRLISTLDGFLDLDPNTRVSRSGGSVAFSPDGQALASRDVDTGDIFVHSIPDGRLLLVLEGQSDGIVDAIIYPDGSLLATWGDDGRIRLVHTANGNRLHTLNGNYSVTTNMFFLSGGDILATTCKDTDIDFWDVSGGSLLGSWTWDHRSMRINAFSTAFSPDERIIAEGRYDGTINLWRLSDTSPIRTIGEGLIDWSPALGYSSIVGYSSVIFSPNGQIIGSGYRNGTIALWHVSDGQLLQRLDGHTEDVISLAFSPQGAMLASASADQTIRLWVVSDGSLRHTMEGHTDVVNDVTFSPDGQILASGSVDHTVRLWEVSSGTLLYTLEGHTGSVNRVVFSPDGRLLYSVSSDGTVRVWGVRP